MRATIIHAPGDIRVENAPEPKIVAPTDAVIRTVATCVCGSDLWGYRGINPRRRAAADRPRVRRHRRGGRQRRIDDQARPVRHRLLLRLRQHLPDLPGRLPHLLPAPRVAQRRQAEYVRVPLADGTLVATPEQPAEELIPSLLALSDVMGTGWYAAMAAEVRPG